MAVPWKWSQPFFSFGCKSYKQSGCKGGPRRSLRSDTSFQTWNPKISVNPYSILQPVWYDSDILQASGKVLLFWLNMAWRRLDYCLYHRRVQIALNLQYCPYPCAHLYAHRTEFVSWLCLFSCLSASVPSNYCHAPAGETLLLPAHRPEPRYICVCFHKTATRIFRFLSDGSCMWLHAHCGIELYLRFLLVSAFFCVKILRME